MLAAGAKFLFHLQWAKIINVHLLPKINLATRLPPEVNPVAVQRFNTRLHLSKSANVLGSNSEGCLQGKLYPVALGHASSSATRPRVLNEGQGDRGRSRRRKVAEH